MKLEKQNNILRVIIGCLVAAIISLIIIAITINTERIASIENSIELPKLQSKQLCSRPAVINKQEKKEGHLFEKSMNMYDMPRYKYKTGFPLTNNDYQIIRL